MRSMDCRVTEQTYQKLIQTTGVEHICISQIYQFFSDSFCSRFNFFSNYVLNGCFIFSWGGVRGLAHSLIELGSPIHNFGLLISYKQPIGKLMTQT